MGAISRGVFIQKWIQANTSLGNMDRLAMIEDLDEMLKYSGGLIKKANEPTVEERAAGVQSPDEIKAARDAEYKQPGSYLGKMEA